MLYDVGLLIHYKYTTPAAGGRHVLYMTPANLDGQRAITSSQVTTLMALRDWPSSAAPARKNWP
jgi:hypothetical protein